MVGETDRNGALFLGIVCWKGHDKSSFPSILRYWEYTWQHRIVFGRRSCRFSLNGRRMAKVCIGASEQFGLAL